MNGAFASPHPVRRPTIAPILFEASANAERTTIRTRLSSSIRIGPIRLATILTTSIETPVKAKHLVNKTSN
jgi:hypothetical protein